MKCMHCQSELSERSSDFTLKILLCKPCAISVAKLKARIRSELEVTLATMDETLRFAIVNQKSGLPDDDAGRSELLDYIHGMDLKCRNTSRTITSSRSTKPSATIADGPGSSTKPSAQE